MAQLSDDCFAFGGALLPVAEALRIIAANVRPVDGIEHLPPGRADGRVLAADVTAPSDLPPFDNSAVDGYAVRAADLDGETVLPVEGRVAAGDVAAPLHPGTARRILTGAPLPEGADTVFMQEDVQPAPGGRVRLPAGLKPGANTRPRGEDVAAGAVALPRGRVLRPQDVALAAALGLTVLPVRRPIRVALFSTGDEIVEPGAKLGPAQRYDSNRVLLAALARRAGAEVTDLGILPDAREPTAQAIAGAAASADLVLSSGGVSTGEEDHVRAAIEGAGRLVFWRLGIKPGRPVAMGVAGGVPFVGLPGNPAAAFVTFVHVVRPLIAALAGATPPKLRRFPVAAGFAYRKKAGRREYVRVRLEEGPDGTLTARKHPREGAGLLTSLTETEGLLELPEDATAVAVAQTVLFLPYSELL